MKKILSSLLLAFLCIATASAYDFSAVCDGDTLYFIKSQYENTVTVTYGNPDGGSYSGHITIPETVEYESVTYKVTCIGSSAFYQCGGLTSVTIPNSITSIDGYAFAACNGLTYVSIPDSVKYIGESAFYGCSNLSAFYGRMASSDKRCLIQDDGTLISFAPCNLSTYRIPNNVRAIGKSAFSACDELTHVTIPHTVTTIGDYAFSRCHGLTQIIIPNSVTTIGVCAFLECKALTKVVLPESVVSIGRSAFHDCVSLEMLDIPDSVKSIGSNVVYNTPLFDDRSNWENGVLYIGHHIIEARPWGDYTIKDGTLTLADSSFSDYTTLTSVTIPSSVTNIGEYVFSKCTKLVSVTILNPNISFGRYAFEGSALYNDPSNWEDGVLYVGSYLVKADSYISGHCVIKDGTSAILPNAFYECEGLTSVTIPNSVASIGEYAFYYCQGLTSVTLPNSLTSIADETFWNCHNLADVFIPESVTSIGKTAFMSCDLASLDIPAAVTSIGDYAFWANDRLTELVIPNSVTSIGRECFAFCYGLTEVTIPNSVTSIGQEAFRSCSLKKVVVDNEDPSQISLGEDVFKFNYVRSAALHVPIGSKDLYANAAQWSNFGNIAEFGNRFYSASATGLKFEPINLGVWMVNTDDLCAMQYDIVLPEGCSIARDAKSKYHLSHSDRFGESHVWAVSDIGDNTVRVICYSNENELISGHDGLLSVIPLMVPNGGSYTVRLTNIEVSKPEMVRLRLPDVEIDVEALDYMLGDVNGDGIVSVTDIVGMVSYILQQPASDFIVEAADLNGDGEVTVTDIVGVVNMILDSSN